MTKQRIIEGIHSATFEEHLIHLDQVFERLVKADLKCKPSKCFFGQSQVKFLGYIVSNRGIHTDPDKTAAIMELPAPV